jgi:hypothetical protein
MGTSNTVVEQWSQSMNMEVVAIGRLRRMLVNGENGGGAGQVLRAILIAVFLLAATPAIAQNGSWVQRSISGTIPGGRAAHAMAYDPVRREIVMFGGYTPSGGLYGDTWTFDGASWALRATTGPSPRANTNMAFDSARGVMVLFGGFAGGSLGDTWEWNGAGWALRTPIGPVPPTRNDHGMTFDPNRNVVVMHGGGGPSGILSDTWEWNGTAWSQNTTAAGPASEATGMDFDTRRGVVVLFAGRVSVSSGGSRGGIFEYNGSTWTERTATGPSPRNYSPLAYDPIRGVSIVTGGNLGGASVTGTWAWNGSTWTQMNVGGPGAWQGHKLAYDSARRQVVQFGGGPGTWTNQTWTLDSPSTPVWISAYHPSLGTLPQAQGWTLESNGSNPTVSIASGVLAQGPTAYTGWQFWRQSTTPYDFDTGVGLVAEFSLKLVSATYADFGSYWLPGWAAVFTDRNNKTIVVGVTDTGIRVSNSLVTSSFSTPFIPLNTTSQYNSYKLVANANGVTLFVNGSLIASLGPAVAYSVDANSPSPNGVYFGDSTGTGQNQSLLQYFSYGVSGVPFSSAGSTDNVVFTGTRPDPGSNGPPVTYPFNSLNVQPGSIFTLGSNETVNLNNGQGTLFIQTGAVFYGNGIILGNIFNSGLFIIPITRTGIVINRTSGGVVRIAPPVILPHPQTPILINPDTPPVVNAGTSLMIGGSGIGSSGSSSGGVGGGGGGSTGRTYSINTPSFTVQGTAAWDGRLDVSGSYTQTATGVLRLFIAGPTQGETYSFLNIGQAANIQGSLQVVLQPELLNFVPAVGNSFDMVFAQGGITLPQTLTIQPLMTLAGAQQLGLTLPTFDSGFASDPNQLVVLPQGTFSFQLVDANRTLRITLDQSFCGVTTAVDDVVSCTGGTASFSTTVIGSGPLTFSWRRDGVAIDVLSNPTAATATLTLLNVSAADNATYDCVISSPCDDYVTNPATLTVSLCKCVDFNRNGVFPEDQDVTDYLNVLAGAPCPTGECNDIDFNGNGVFPEDQDVVDFLNVLAGGDC